MKIFYAFLLGLAASSSAAAAAPQCAAREMVLSTLQTKYGETRRNIGIAANNGVIEIFASAETGTWTITITMADGTTCLVASGENFETVTEQLPAKGEPA